MKSSKRALSGALFVAFVALVASTLGGCSNAPEVFEIKPNETAFLIQMDGNTKNQKAFMSEEYLTENKVASKRIVIPYVDVPGGRIGQRVLAAKLIAVDRTPVTREWTRSEKTGTSPSNQAIAVESNQSIDFTVGVVMTASIPEQNAAKFLYHYAGTPLSTVADTNIRGFVQAALAREFGALDLDAARKEKGKIFDRVFKAAREEFAARGISIDTLGYSEGMTYTDPNIQRAINETFEAQMAAQKAEQKVLEARQMRLAAEEFAKAKEASIARVELDVRLMQAQAQLKMAEKWDGRLPANVLPQGSNFLFGMDKAVQR